MYPRTFDGMIRRLSESLSRRSLVGGSLGAFVLAAVGLGDDEALAKKKCASAEACIPTGKKCPARKPRGKKKKTLGCDQCCQGFVETITNRKGKRVNKCSCGSGGAQCEFNFQCCSDTCETDGRCGDVCVSLGNVCDADSDCCSGHCNDTAVDPPFVCAPCKPTGGECNFGDSIECCSRVCIPDAIDPELGTCA